MCAQQSKSDRPAASPLPSKKQLPDRRVDESPSSHSHQQASVPSNPSPKVLPHRSSDGIASDSRASSPHVAGYTTPKTRGRDRAYWSSSHPDDPRHRKHHHHNHGHHHRPLTNNKPSFSHYSDNLIGSGHHSLSRDNRSLQDLTILNSLVDDRTGYYEDRRATDEYLHSVGKKKKVGNDLRAYYERMNLILDGWREVDEILDSHFPEEVMRRFGTVEEVEQMKRGRKKRLPWLEDSDEGEDSGYQEESEVDSEDDTRKQRRRESLTARAASALSGFWFGTPSSSSTSKLNGKARITDEESALVSSSPRMHPSDESPSLKRGSSYGATNRYKPPIASLTTIEDAGETTTTTTTNTDPSPGESAKVGEVLMKDDTDGKKLVAVGHDPEQLKERAKTQLKVERQKRKEKKLIITSDTDDEMTTEDASSEPIEAGSLDRRLAKEREERKSRSKLRDVVVPGTGGQVTRLNGRSISTGNESEVAKTKKQKSTPGGLSERERMKLLEHVPGRAEKEDERERGARFAININLAVNVLLLAGKAFAVISSNSVSLLASLVDSALDLLSTIIIFGTSKAIAYRSWHTYFKYPVGKKRFEPLGVVIFSVLMIASFCQVLVESAERLWKVIKTGSEGPSELAELPLVGIAFMILTIIIKAFMWVIYRKSPSSGVRAVAQDAENDVVFNVASLIFPVIGSKLGWPALDPIGGVCLSIYIIWEWVETLTETVAKLSGAAASPDAVTRALYLVTRFRSVESVSAFELYHAGDDLIAEADVVLPLGLALKEAHDLGEIITYCLESIGHERAYVHADYDARGQRGHISERG